MGSCAARVPAQPPCCIKQARRALRPARHPCWARGRATTCVEYSPPCACLHVQVRQLPQLACLKLECCGYSPGSLSQLSSLSGSLKRFASLHAKVPRVISSLTGLQHLRVEASMLGGEQRERVAAALRRLTQLTSLVGAGSGLGMLRVAVGLGMLGSAGAGHAQGRCGRVVRAPDSAHLPRGSLQRCLPLCGAACSGVCLCVCTSDQAGGDLVRRRCCVAGAWSRQPRWRACPPCSAAT